MVDYLFVYFCIVEYDVVVVLLCWQCWFDIVEEVIGVVGVLMCCLEICDGQVMWMEFYNDVLFVFVVMLVVLWEIGGLCEFIVGECYVELFVDLENS